MDAQQRTAEPIQHPCMTDFPFMELDLITATRRMITPRGVEVIACSPVEVADGRGSYFNCVFEENGEMMVRTMMGRSDHARNMWVYAREEVTPLKEVDLNYKKARKLLEAA